MPNGLDPRIANYFDNAATTPLDPRVFEAMLPFLRDDFGNAHSLHAWGAKAWDAVEKARMRVGQLTGWDPELVFFTSGATEANNWVLSQFSTGVASPFEHSSVREPAIARGFDIWPPEGAVPAPTHPVHMPGSAPYEIQSLMLVNNETGTRWDPRQWLGGDFHHTDATQALGKIALSGDEADFVTCSAHKLYGPKGVGALLTGQFVEPFVRGGEQEQGMRAGTLNVAAIVGFGAACDLAAQEMEANTAHVSRLREALLEPLAGVSDWQINGMPPAEAPNAGHVPHILSLSFLGLEGETLVLEADRAGFAISAGAACSSRSTEPSHVLVAMGLDEAWRRGTIRISFGRFNTLDSAAALGKVLAASAERLRMMR